MRAIGKLEMVGIPGDFLPGKEAASFAAVPWAK